MEGQTNPPEELVGDHTIAWFPSIDRTRHAVLALERSGVDSTYIEVARRPTTEDRTLVDKRSMAWIAKLFIIGSVIGLVIGAAVGAAIVALIGAEGSVLIAGVIAGGVFGFFAGGFGLLVVELPVNGSSYDTFGGEPVGSDWVAVGGPRDVRQKAGEVLGAMHPVQMSEAA